MKRIALITILLFATLRAAQAPDVVLVTIDTLRADRVGAYGYAKARTPHLDALAREGVLFRRAFTPVPLTLPAHASLMTGAYPPFHGVRDNAGFQLGEDRRTLAEALKAKGYATAAVVACFVLDSRFGLSQGFDHYYDRFDLSNLTSVNPGYVQRRGDRVVDEALRWLGERGSDESVFLWVHLYDPHDPYDPPEEFAKRHPGRPYDGEVEFADAQLGRLLDALRAGERYENALIVVAGDHGEDLGDHGEGTHGFFLYNATLHIPLIARLPQGQAAGRVVDDNVSLVDILPTAAQILRLPREAVSDAQGRGLLSLILEKGDRSRRPDLYAETYYPRHQFGWSQLWALIQGDDKYILSPSPELYDLAEDFQESRNLAAQDQALANGLRSRLQEMRARIGREEAAAEASSPLDAETEARLASLGYAAVSRGVPDGDGQWRQLPAPADRLDVFQRVVRLNRLVSQERYEEAIEGYREVLKSEPGLKLAIYKLGQSYFRTQRFEKALEQFKRLAELGGDSAMANFDLALTYFRLGRLQEASLGLKLVLERDPDHVRALTISGVIAKNQGRLAEAVEHLEKAVELAPEDVFALGNLGVSYSLSNRHQDALRVLEKAVSLQPENALLHANLASAYGRAGNPEKAREHMEAARRLNPELFRR